MRKIISKVLKLALICFMILGIMNKKIVSSGAQTATNSNTFPREDSTIYNGKISYDGNIVGDFTVNGHQAFCMAHPIATPGTGVKLTSQIYNNSNVQKVLYYGWGGPEQWSGFKNRSHGIVVTSLALSYYYYGDNSSPSTIKSFIDFVSSKTMPDFQVQFSKAKVQAYKSGSIQKTESITLKSGSDTFGVTVSLQNNVTYVDETHNTRQTGGSVTIKGKTTFHLEAPLNVNLGQWTTGAKAMSYDYSPIMATAKTGTYQPLGYYEFTYDPSKTTSLTVDWLSLGDLKIAKQDNKGNKVPNTQFKISYNSDMTSPIGTYTTTSDGSVTINDLTPQNVYIQETSVPSHLVLDNTVHSIEIKTGETVTFTQTNNWKQGYIEVTKYDKKTNQNC